MSRQFRDAALVVAACAGLGLTSAASAVDLRDWGRTFAASERFVVLGQFGNQAVLDKETQLVWQRAPGNELVSYDTAWNRCDRANSGGRMGWRLPTLPELRSLIDPAIYNQSVASLPSKPERTFVSRRRSPPSA